MVWNWSLDFYDTGRFILECPTVLVLQRKFYYESKEIMLYGNLTTA